MPAAGKLPFRERNDQRVVTATAVTRHVYRLDDLIEDVVSVALQDFERVGALRSPGNW